MYQLEEPHYLYLLAIVPLALLLFAFRIFWVRRRQRAFGDAELVKKLSPDRSMLKSTVKLVLGLMAVIALALAVVNPLIGTKMETVKREGIDIVFAIDVSKSMLAEDVAPSRLEKSKQVVSQIINQLAGDRIGIVAYAGSAFPVLPITTDYGVAKMYLQSLNTNMVSSQGTSLDEAIETATGFFDKESKTSKLVILISDGEDHSEGAENMAAEARKNGLKIITIGVGTEKGGPIPLRRNGVVESFKRDRQNQVVVTRLNKEVLESIAKNTKGGYVDGANTKTVTEYIKNALDKIERNEFESTQLADFESQFQWFAGIALFLLVVDVLLLERKTTWLRKLNLFNERES